MDFPNSRLTVSGAFSFVNNVLLAVGACVLALMMFFTVVDIVGRYVFNRPIEGGFELVEFMMAIFVPTALVYCEEKKSHISVDLFFEKFPKLMQKIIAIFTSLLTVLYFGLICWQSYLAIGEEISTRVTSSVLMIPTYPFFIPLVVSFGMLTIFLLIHLVQLINNSGRG